MKLITSHCGIVSLVSDYKSVQHVDTANVIILAR